MYTAHVHFFTNLDLFCIDNARVIYRKIRYLLIYFTSIQLHGNNGLVNMQKVIYTIKSIDKECNSNALIEGNRIHYFKIRYYRYSCYRLPSDTNILQELHSSVNYTHVIIIIIYVMELGHLLTHSVLTYPEVSSRSNMFPYACWGVVFHYPG